MNRRRRLRLWGHFAGVTIVLAIPVVAVYFFLAAHMQASEEARFASAVNNQVNMWQERLDDLVRDARVDTRDDAMLLGGGDEAALLRRSLVRYIFPDGRSRVEGIAVVNPDGRLRPSRQAAVIDDQGRPLAPARLAMIKRQRPWVDNPWLSDYNFVIEALARDPGRRFFFSRLKDAPGRKVLVLASARRDRQGRLQAAVILQVAARQIFDNLFKAGSRGQNTWLMDRSGRLGFTRGKLARASAERFRGSGRARRALAAGARAAGQGHPGAAGQRWQDLDGTRGLLVFRTQGDNLLVGVFTTEQAMVQKGGILLRAFGGVSLLAILLLAAGGAIYTFLALRREGRMVELATLRRYAGTVSHRVRNELVTLYGQVELVSSGLITDPEKIAGAFGGPVQDSLDNIMTMVQELEAISRGEMELGYDGQAGDDTMFKVGRNQGGEGR